MTDHEDLIALRQLAERGDFSGDCECSACVKDRAMLLRVADALTLATTCERQAFEAGEAVESDNCALACRGCSGDPVPAIQNFDDWVRYGKPSPNTPQWPGKETKK